MANFDRLAEQGQAFFLRYDQQEMIRRFGLEADASFLFVRFCGEEYRVDRSSAAVTRPDGGAAGPAAALTIYDMLCSAGGGLSGQWCTTNSLPGGGQAAPSETVLLQDGIRRFEEHPAELLAACRSLGGVPFPVGDVAWEFPVFDWFPAVFQFFRGDDEFPSATRFLWDRSALRYLHYETLYYIMGHVLGLLQERL